MSVSPFSGFGPRPRGSGFLAGFGSARGTLLVYYKLSLEALSRKAFDDGSEPSDLKRCCTKTVAIKIADTDVP